MVITEQINLLLLTPVQRLEAIRNMYLGPNFTRDKWYILAGCIGIFALTISLVVVRRKNAKRQNDTALSLFSTNSDNHGLDNDQRRLVKQIANYVSERNPNIVFRSAEAFDKGAAIMMNKQFKTGIALEQRKSLNLIISNIKEKLGLTKPTFRSRVRSSRSAKLTSRYVSQGKDITLIDPMDTNNRVEVTVAEVNDSELLLKPKKSIEIVPGQIWRVHYQLGASVWEFESCAIGAQDGNLILSHSENVRFINRRRFQRVSVNKSAWIAKFPCFRCGDAEDKDVVPFFHPATLIEMSGPGLRIKSDIKVKTNERILVIIEPANGSFIQDVGEVRHTRTVDDGHIIAIELVGLDEDANDRIIRYTNEQAMKSQVELAEAV